MKSPFLYLIFILVLIGFHQSCTHDPFMPDDMEPDPMDTTTTMLDTMGMDTTMMGNPCDPEVIYFEKDILPILKGNCAFSGCHDAASASDGVILDNYDDVISTGEVKAFDLGDSELYEVITENDPDKVMPPTGKLDNETINLIAQWILQGAQNLKCDEEGDCETANVSYDGFVKGVFATSCNGCHSTAAAFGGVILDNYNNVLTQVNNGKLYGSINWDQGFSRMPQGQDQLDQCSIDKIKSWIDDGAPNN